MTSPGPSERASGVEILARGRGRRKEGKKIKRGTIHARGSRVAINAVRVVSKTWRVLERVRRVVRPFRGENKKIVNPGQEGSFVIILYEGLGRSH